MTKITEQDRSVMTKHLRELSKLSLKANIKHHSVIDKDRNHTIQLTKFLQEDRAKIDRLNNVIDMKQREIDELNSKQIDLLWDLSKLEKRCGELEKKIISEDIKSAQVQKRISERFNLESTDN